MTGDIQPEQQATLGQAMAAQFAAISQAANETVEALSSMVGVGKELERLGEVSETVAAALDHLPDHAKYMQRLDLATRAVIASMGQMQQRQDEVAREAPQQQQPQQKQTDPIRLVEEVVRKLAGKENLANIADVRDNLSQQGMDRGEQDRLIRELRATQVLSASGYEGRHGVSQREQDAAIPEGQARLGYLSFRDPQRLAEPKQPTASPVPPSPVGQAFTPTPVARDRAQQEQPTQPTAERIPLPVIERPAVETFPIRDDDAPLPSPLEQPSPTTAYDTIPFKADEPAKPERQPLDLMLPGEKPNVIPFQPPPTSPSGFAAGPDRRVEGAWWNSSPDNSIRGSEQGKTPALGDVDFLAPIRAKFEDFQRVAAVEAKTRTGAAEDVSSFGERMKGMWDEWGGDVLIRRMRMFNVGLMDAGRGILGFTTAILPIPTTLSGLVRQSMQAGSPQAMSSMQKSWQMVLAEMTGAFLPAIAEVTVGLQEMADSIRHGENRSGNVWGWTGARIGNLAGRGDPDDVSKTRMGAFGAGGAMYGSTFGPAGSAAGAAIGTSVGALFDLLGEAKRYFEAERIGEQIQPRIAAHQQRLDVELPIRSGQHGEELRGLYIQWVDSQKGLTKSFDQWPERLKQLLRAVEIEDRSDVWERQDLTFGEKMSIQQGLSKPTKRGDQAMEDYLGSKGLPTQEALNPLMKGVSEAFKWLEKSLPPEKRKELEEQQAKKGGGRQKTALDNPPGYQAQYQQIADIRRNAQVAALGKTPAEMILEGINLRNWEQYLKKIAEREEVRERGLGVPPRGGV